jgi:aryl-alcohol dehydrogenase-like predicted oxidoreductase
MNAQQSGTFLIGGDLPVHRLGFGAMRITGPGVWGPPEDEAEALAVLRRAVELEVDFIDTAEPTARMSARSSSPARSIPIRRDS